MPVLNTAYTAWIAVLEDDEGTPITGATWDTSGSLNPSGAAWPSTVTISGVGNRYQLVGYSFNAIGSWLLISVPNGDTALAVNRTFEVVTDPASDAETVAAAVRDQLVSGAPTGSIGAQLARISQIGTGTITVASPVAADESITLTQGDVYEGDDALPFARTTWDIAADANITMTVTYAGMSTTFEGTRISAGAVQVELSGAESGALVPGRNLYRYAVRANDDVLVTGLITVRQG